MTSISNGKGKLYVVGIGPGGKADRTHRAEKAIIESDAVVGYNRYLDNIADLTEGKEMKASGKTVAFVSSGDPGVYGMAGLAFEMAKKMESNVKIEVIPGISAANTAAAKLGAPLMLDYAVISLSDLLVPWEQIVKRLDSVASADMVCVLYNPRSKKRVEQLNEAAAIFSKYRDGSTLVGVCTNISYEGEESIIISNLEKFLEEDIGMMTTVVIGSSNTENIEGWMVTPRGYAGKRF
jgi:precorrin-3B C17-methyltransferase